MNRRRSVFSNGSRLIVTMWLCLVPCLAQERVVEANLRSYLDPYVRTQNFAGAVRIERDGKVLFEEEYGLADREKGVANDAGTRFHIASISMQFTAAAVLRLVDQGTIKLDTRVGEIVSGIPGGDKITIRNLLVERSGLTDINNLPEYTEILQQHQTPESLVAKIKDRPLLFEPGSKYLHEEHSAYNLLALIVEKKTGLSFAKALKTLVFEPAHLSQTLIDDDTSGGGTDATGYRPVGVSGLERAPAIHWSAKTGNASVVTTARDQARWVTAEFEGQLLKDNTARVVRETDPRVGFGWMRGASERYHETTYYMNGRAPGFSSFVLYLPSEKMTVVVLSNIYSSATTTIGYDLAAISLGLPYGKFRVGNVSRDQLKRSTGKFQFGADFYQANAQVTIAEEGPNLELRWPSGDISPLIAIEPDRFVDRSYWEEVRIERDEAGSAKALLYGQFRGTKVD